MSLLPILGPSWTTYFGSLGLVAVAVLCGGIVIGSDHEKAKATTAILKAQQEARETEAKWQINLEAQNELHAEEIDRINTARLTAERGLRNRAGRMPAPSASAADAAGATGRELSRPDAEFLAGLAADADRTAADLRACQAWIKAVTTGK